jgi:hypothetical protein
LSKDDPSFKRLSTILTLFIVVFVLSVCQAVLLRDYEAYGQVIGINPNMPDELSDEFNEIYPEEDIDYPSDWAGWEALEENQFPARELLAESGEVNAWGVVLDIVGFFFGAFFIKIATLPVAMTVIIVPVYIILLLVFWYIVLDFIKDIEILGSSI